MIPENENLSKQINELSTEVAKMANQEKQKVESELRELNVRLT
jgi:hypothetical protein